MTMNLVTMPKGQTLIFPQQLFHKKQFLTYRTMDVMHTYLKYVAYLFGYMDLLQGKEDVEGNKTHR